MQSTAIIHRCRPFTAASLLSSGLNPFSFRKKNAVSDGCSNVRYANSGMDGMGLDSRQAGWSMEHLTTVLIKQLSRKLFSTQAFPVLPPHQLPTNFYRLWVTLFCYPLFGYLPLWVYLLKWNELVFYLCDKHFEPLHFRTSNLLSLSISCLLSQRGGCSR